MVDQLDGAQRLEQVARGPRPQGLEQAAFVAAVGEDDDAEALARAEEAGEQPDVDAALSIGIDEHHVGSVGGRCGGDIVGDGDGTEQLDAVAAAIQQPAQAPNDDLRVGDEKHANRSARRGVRPVSNRLLGGSFGPVVVGGTGREAHNGSLLDGSHRGRLEV